MLAEPAFGLGDTRRLLATGQATVDRHQLRLPFVVAGSIEYRLDQFLRFAFGALRHQGPGGGKHDALTTFLGRQGAQVGGQQALIGGPFGDIAQMRLGPDFADHFRRQRSTLVELAGQLEHAIPVARPLPRPQLQTQGRDMASLFGLQALQREQRLVETARLVHHLGFQHQRRRFSARIVQRGALHPALLLFRFAHALRRPRRDQRRQARRRAGGMRLAGFFQRLTKAPFKQQANGILEN